MAVRLFVGNLSYSTTEADLRTHLGTVAPPAQVVLPVDRETGRPRGFAFVEFENDEDAPKAIEKFNGFQFSGRALRVNAAEDRPRSSGPRPSFGGGGGGYGGGGDFDRDAGYGGGGYGGGGGKSKGSRRNVRAKKRSL